MVMPPVTDLGQTFEIVVDCRSNQLARGVYVQSTFLTIPADGVSPWTTSATPPTGSVNRRTASPIPPERITVQCALAVP
jgi:hypothetical protein